MFRTCPVESPRRNQGTNSTAWYEKPSNSISKDCVGMGSPCPNRALRPRKSLFRRRRKRTGALCREDRGTRRLRLFSSSILQHRARRDFTRRRIWPELPRATQIRLSMPLMLDAAHQQGAIEFDRARWEVRWIVEEAGADFVDRERFPPPKFDNAAPSLENAMGRESPSIPDSPLGKTNWLPPASRIWTTTAMPRSAVRARTCS